MIRKEGESVYDVGSIFLAPHTCLSSYRNFWKTGLAGSRPSRVYSGLSGEQRSETVTYLVEMVDESHQIVASMVSHPLLILFPTKYVADLIVKLGGRLVETTELIQGIV